MLCTGNSARSILAEYLINHHLGDRWQAFSAGVDPSTPNPLALRILMEMGISPKGAKSKSIDEFHNQEIFDLVITVCDHAKETCPVFHKPVETVHINIEDPKPPDDASEQIALGVFRKTARAVIDEVIGFLVDK